ncbi:putative phosphatase [Hoeflea phototrophica DFL-43]|uniref:Putative phosphatase n=1 Tax=Hoeflea phototrophica (strain DSM 17068 / NCIMB 14078 / DFL-43) TaxID=411684 RepID=A9DBD9_HOEPD|nr:PhoX family phosphatase [Hoeflea phototrophica]EDQ32496.1 putative phosphatase [Hoeflea phototrophica DFL-43]
MNEMFKPEDEMINLTEIREAEEDVGRNTSDNPTMGDVINRRFSRRGFLGGSLAVTAIATTVSPLALMIADEARAEGVSAFSFTEVEAGVDETHHVAEGYDADVLLRWGDKVFADSPEFDPMNQTAESQSKQFGYNNDYVGFIPLDGADDHGLLVVNHEYTNAELMFPNWASIGKDGEGKDKVMMGEFTKDIVDIEMAAHGGTVIEIRKENGKWVPVLDGTMNRRLHVGTEMALSGPAAGHDRVKTNADPSGTKVLGTLNNCAGGVTPWGTWLMAEENFHGYFVGELPEGHPETVNYERYGAPRGWYNWGTHHDRFDVSKEPNEPNRFGWVVEVDPTDPNSVPKKRTALGRMKHEGAESVLNKDGRVVFYCGDDERFDYVYKFVTAGTYNPDDRAANMDLLDDGTLYVARFNADGTLDWMPLVHGEGPLNADNGFTSQADVVIEARRAGDLLGATKMDRPEDVQPNAMTGKVYCMLTNNTRRKAGDENAANPRADNAFGHIIEISETDGDFAATKSTWEILIKCGDPSVAEVGASFSSATTKDGWFGMPDNCAIDADGRLWVSTDGNSAKKTGRTDGLWAVDTEGDARATSKLFFRVPVGAEMCGPLFDPTGETVFLAVQHPGDEGLATYEQPATRWPDFRDDMPVRPAVVAVTKQGGGKIGMA